MASRMNSGGSNDLNRIKIDPRTGKKLSFNVGMVAWPGSERSFGLYHHFFFTSDQNTALKLMAYKTLRF